MEYSAKSNKIETLGAKCLAVGVYAGKRAKLSASAQRLDKVSGKTISKVVAGGDISGDVGSTLVLHQVPGVPR